MPEASQLSILLAHWALEDGNGAAMHCYNIGNFKGHEPQNYCKFETTEVVNDKTVKMVCQFVAYDSLADGCQAYMHSFMTRWTKAWTYVIAGDVDGFAQALKDEGYYTANEIAYDHGLRARLVLVLGPVQTALALLPTDPAPPVEFTLPDGEDSTEDA